MLTEVIVTGSGAPRPHPQRAGPGLLVRRGGLCLQVDAGRGTAMRLAALGVSCRDLDVVLLTHHHSDHLVDLADLALSRWTVLDRPGPDCPLRVVAPRGPAARFAAALLDPWAADIAVRRAQTGRPSTPAVEVLEFDPGPRPAPVWEGDGVRVLAARVHHPPVEPAVGFRIETPEGVVAVSGDTRPCEEVLALAAGAEVLVHEAVLGSRVAGEPWGASILGYHAEAEALGRLLAGGARRCAAAGAGAGRGNAASGPPTLLLTHLIPAPAGEAEEREYAAAVRRGGYAGRVVVARDLTRVVLGDD